MWRTICQKKIGVKNVTNNVSAGDGSSSTRWSHPNNVTAMGVHGLFMYFNVVNSMQLYTRDKRKHAVLRNAHDALWTWSIIEAAQRNTAYST